VLIPYDSGDEADGCEEVSGESVIAGGDAAEVFETTESILDAVALLVGFSVEAEGLLAIGLVWNDGPGAALVEPLAQIGAVVSPVAEKLACRPRAADQALCGRAIMRLSAGQKDGKKAAFSICDCVDFRVAPAARAANGLLVLPLFAPDAERCALIWVESIICVSVDRPRAASSRNSRSHIPRSAQRTKRL
jgi:hypothetical protein